MRMSASSNRTRSSGTSTSAALGRAPIVTSALRRVPQRVEIALDPGERGLGHVHGAVGQDRYRPASAAPRARAASTSGTPASRSAERSCWDTAEGVRYVAAATR